MGKKAAAVFCIMMLWLTCVSSSETAGQTADRYHCSTTDCETADIGFALKQICMCDIQSGWALTAENELLFTDQGAERFRVVKKVEGVSPDTDVFLDADLADGQTAYLAYFSEDDGLLTVEHTGDGGASWQKTALDYTGFGDSCDAGSVYLSFADQEKGYLLYCSTPAAGSMTKILLETIDGGKTFDIAADLSGRIAGYPRGLAFVGGKGYLAVSYHGEDSYLYTTADGGITWEDEKIAPIQTETAEAISYIDGYPPVFTDSGDRGVTVLKTVGDRAAYRIFRTEDGGDSWRADGEIPCDSLTGYTLCGDSILFLDGGGRLYEISE